MTDHEEWALLEQRQQGEPWRFLQDENEDENSQGNDGQKLRDTFILYGSLLCGCFLLFCYVRRRFPRPYTIRNWVEDHRTYLAAEQYGFFSWVFHMFYATEDELLDEIGMDSLCLLRVLQMGWKTSVVGVLNAIWLMPLYHYAETRDDTAGITDKIVETTIAHVPEQSPKLVGTAIAAYFVFGYLMHLMLQEFEWFTEKRHKYLQKPMPRNYTVFVRNIPPEYRSSKALEHFFESCFAGKDVYQAAITIQTANLQKSTAARTKAVANLEHAVLYHDVKGVRPTHKPGLVGAMNMAQSEVDSIDYYAEEVKRLNDEITEQILAIRGNQTKKESDQQASLLDGDKKYPPLTEIEAGSSNTIDENATLMEPPVEEKSSLKSSLNPMKGVASLTKTAGGFTKSLASEGMALISGKEDGVALPGGFVTFSKVAIANAALQMTHHGTPFTMEVEEAPAPDDIFWPNVNRSHKDLQVGKLLSIATTTTICLLWSIPMTFANSISNVDALREQFDFIDSLLNSAPFLVPIFEQLAPLIVVIVDSMLPIILEYVTLMEGPVSGSVVEAGLFTKLAAFSVIQTFFVSAVSGSILKALNDLVDSPTKIVSILATALPSQSTFFIQLLFVETVVTDAIMEAFRLVPIGMAIIRSFVGPNLNQKERETTFMGFLRPFADPLEFEHADILSTVVLMFMILLVYAVIAPLTTFVAAFCFLYKAVLYRHQFIYIYPTTPDSGGKMWLSFMRNLPFYMLIAQVTIVGLLALKQATIGVPLMIPLIIITFLFKQYISQQHFTVPMRLPTRECVQLDAANGPSFEPTFAKDAYIQPELRELVTVPEIDRELLDKYDLHDHTRDEEVEEGGDFVELQEKAGDDNRSLAGSILSALSFGRPKKE